MINCDQLIWSWRFLLLFINCLNSFWCWNALFTHDNQILKMHMLCTWEKSLVGIVLLFVLLSVVGNESSKMFENNHLFFIIIIMFLSSVFFFIFFLLSTVFSFQVSCSLNFSFSRTVFGNSWTSFLLLVKLAIENRILKCIYFLVHILYSDILLYLLK